MGGIKINSMKLYIEDSEAIPAIQVLPDADPAPSGFTEDTSIEGWDKYALRFGNVDFKAVRAEIKTLVASKTYALCTTAEKIIALQFFVAGPGIDYFDPLLTQEQYATYHKELNRAIDQANAGRDEAATLLLEKNILTGVISRLDGERMADDARKWRQQFRLDRIEGESFGDNVTGFFDWLDNTNKCASTPVLAVDTVLKTFTIGGKKVGKVLRDDSIGISGSTGNDGYYTISEITEVAGDTVISVVEAISDATVDGDCYWCGFFAWSGSDATLLNGLKDIYENGKY